MRRVVMACMAGAVAASAAYGQSTYQPPTAEEMAPLRPEYLAELAKIHEPPEMSGKPMQVRKAAPPEVPEILDTMSRMREPDKATHEQRDAAIGKLLEIADRQQGQGGMNRGMTFAVIATLACIDGADTQKVVGYATEAINDYDDANASRDGSVALRARMYLKKGDRERALKDLEEILADGEGHALLESGTDPRKDSSKCGWGLADFDALGDDPRALSAKAFYLSSFISFGAEDRGTVKESEIRDLYKRAEKSWHSPIPYLLEVKMNGLGSVHSMDRSRCLRPGIGGRPIPSIEDACRKYDEGTQQEIRTLTMALVTDPKSSDALGARAEKYYQLAEGYYLDEKPSLKLFELAIGDYAAAIAAGGKNKHILYCDHALALASIGKYKEAAAGYEQCMKFAKNGVEDSPFVYEQLAGLYMKLGQFNDAAATYTQGIINSAGGGFEVIIFGGGMHGFRTLYPEYQLLPDEILAEVVRRRYEPQFASSWDADFIGKGGNFAGKVSSSILPEFYALRGDAYMKAGRRAEALADYNRVISDAWNGSERLAPKNMYFNEAGARVVDSPEKFPPAPPKS